MFNNKQYISNGLAKCCRGFSMRVGKGRGGGEMFNILVGLVGRINQHLF